MPRNAAGVYTLPNPPVVTDTTILSDDENVTRDDIAAELTNSLSRSGQGGMLAPFRIADGIEVAPGLSFLNDPDSGIYRSSSDTWHLVAGATTQATINTFGFGVKSTPTATNPFVANFVVSQLGAVGQAIRATGMHTMTANNNNPFYGFYTDVVLNPNGFDNAATIPNGGALSGIASLPSVTGAGAIANVAGVFSNPLNIGTAIIALMASFVARGSNTGGGVIDHFTGFHAVNTNVGTLTTGFSGLLDLGINKWNLYMSGTAPNFLLGPLTQGIADLLTVEGLQPTVQVWDGIAALNRFSNNGVGNTLYFNKSRSANYAGFNVLAAGDDIASLKFMGSDGVTLQQAGAILVEVLQAPVAGAVPGKLTFQLADISGAQVDVLALYSTNAYLTTTLTSIVASGANIDMAHVTTNAADKISNIRSLRFVNADTPFLGMRLVDNGIDNIITFGGGSGTHAAATQIQFRTAAYAAGGGAGTVRAAVLPTGEWVFGSLIQAQEVDGFSAGVQINGNSGPTAMSFNRFIANSSGNLMYFSKSRGANLGTYSILVVNDDIHTFYFMGADGSALRAAAAILTEVDQAPVANTAVPGRFIFQTTNLAGALTEVLRLDSKGNVRINLGSIGANGEGVLSLATAGVVPTSSPAGSLQIYGAVGVGGSTSLQWRQPQAVAVIGTFTPSHKVRVGINGTEYDIQLDQV